MSLTVPSSLNRQTWRRAGAELLAKTLGELSYEDLLRPQPVSGEEYRIELPGGVTYEFTARRGAFADWRVAPDRIVRVVGATREQATDPLLFLRDAHTALGISGDTAGHLARELTATLAADTRLRGSNTLSVAELAEVPYAELEGHQTGHPWLVPNKGRVGFSASDSERYAPEARQPYRLPWIAVHRSLATYRAVAGLDRDVLLAGELDEATRHRFTVALAAHGVAVEEYEWLPVHPWQWDEVVLPTFAADVAHKRIVPLGEAPDRYRPQQSIRTLSNIDQPQRHHVKLPLSILNTLVWRGLPTERTVAAPAVTAWVLDLACSDPFLRDETGAILLGEVASVTVRHTDLESIPEVPYQYRELLGAIWRQPLEARLSPGERARTLASLLYVDGHGEAFVAELVRRCGLGAEEWLARLFGALLPPLLHFLYRYGVVFSPHGENTIVVFDGDVPRRLAVKDFVDDVNVSESGVAELESMPAEVDAALLREPPEFLRQFIQSGLFVGHFRYLAPIVEQHLGVDEDRFWTLVADEVIAYQKRFPELAERFALFDLFTPEIDRLCLNRNRLLLDGYRDRPERPHAAVHGTVPNPLYHSISKGTENAGNTDSAGGGAPAGGTAGAGT
ncbi:IucA/IucC family siderophore biosynthesis protein [Haloechinothrix sp. LS1_15]|uniref:IucA/IucC family protein n=1 Tax=Haloechinothrix sp. LS1_15 TaxID=2652248 RepID=UPI002947DA20|nr:IucA/IucC family siderophore biosynthesis protein [Haloechinothrix sp. LS1_15]MDV6012738.1 IucA/IucC family siderophore biosynthesis protein [Haloechinothrix sp. LS1_15]